MVEPTLNIIENPLQKRYRALNRFPFLLTLLGIVMAILIGRSFYLQIVQGSEFRARAEGNRVAQLPIPAPRGVVYDRKNVQLTENISNTDLVLDPVLLPSQDNEAYLVENLPHLVPDLKPEEVVAALEKARRTQRVVPLDKSISHDTVLKLEEAGDSIRGARLASTLVRRYPFAQSLAHVLGYTSSVSAEELTKNNNLLPTDSTGKSGLEKKYEEKLRGQHGIIATEINAAGKPQTDLGRQDAVAGEDLHTTLDSDLQKFIYGLFSDRDQKSQKDGKGPVAGAAVVLDPVTGGILSLVSYPSYNPNAFSQPEFRRQTKEIFESTSNPLFNRATEGTYPSGSVIKPFLASGALQEGIITERTTVLSTGGLKVGPWHFDDWKAGGHGITDVKKALADSVNTFFYIVTGGYENQKGLGVEKADEYLKAFGWDAPTGIDLPSEGKGFLPTPKWKLEAKGEPWYIGDTYHLGIGQGDVLVTPLQIAMSTAAIANGQYLPQPHIEEGATHKKNIPISPANINIVRAGMRLAVTDGSARSLSTLPMPLAGKTGTAQIGGTEKTHAWFTSFGPYEKPQAVVTILLDQGGAGDEEAVPIAKEIWQWWDKNGNTP